MVNLPHGQEIQGSLGVRSLLLRSILRLVWLNVLSVPFVRRVIGVLGMGFALISTSAVSAGTDNAAVLATNAAFYAALNKIFAGDVGPMKAVWSHAADVTYMGPTGNFDRGWPAIHKNWEGQAALKLGGRVEPAEVSMIVGQDLAVLNAYEQGENTNAKGKVERVRLRATNVFRKEGGQWKMVGHQTDPLPYLTKPAK
jgi:ketosteroid isomerase-like protein